MNNNDFYIFAKKSNIQLTPNFNSDEFDCHCGKNHQNMISKELIYCLQTLRDIIQKPIKINSAYRCQEYNDSINGSSKKSNHIKGIAVDISVSGISHEDLRIYAAMAGFGGVGKYKNFTHLDIRGDYCVFVGKY
jgi:uncharacterized protein YcbK (DUF882 family)